MGEGERKIITLLEGSQALPARPSGRSSMKTKVYEEEEEEGEGGGEGGGGRGGFRIVTPVA